MSQNRNAPPRTRPDLGRPTDRRRSRRDLHAASKEEAQDAVVEGVTGLRPEIPAVEEPFVTSGRPGWLGAVAAGGASALASWVLLAAVVSVAWLTAPVGPYPAVLRVATQLWLAGHGAGLVVDGTRWTLVPYGLTLVLVALLAQVGTSVLRRLGDADADAGPAAAGLARTVLLALAYAMAVALAGLLAGGPGQSARALGGGLLVAAAAAWWARARTAGRVRIIRWPSWAVDVGRGLAAGLALLVAVGSAALVTGLVVHRGQLVMLTEELGGGVLGGLGAIIAQAAYVPTFVMWAVSYTLGAGFGLGDGSLVSPADTRLGLLPAWPVTAALPTPGAGGPLDLVWLAGGVLAGGLAAWVYLRRSPWTRPDATMLLGGLVGILLGLVVTLAGLLTRGDLGVARLAGLGPRPLELVVLATVLATAGGLLAGLVFGITAWVGSRRRRAATGAAAEAAGTGTEPGARSATDGPSPTADLPPASEAAMAPESVEEMDAPARAEGEARPETVSGGEEPVEVTGPVLPGRSAIFGAMSADSPRTQGPSPTHGPASDSPHTPGSR